MADRPSAFRVGPISIQDRLTLAPMDGYTDHPFRWLCRQLGSAASYTEFVRAGDVLDRPHRIADKLFFQDAERPVFFQLYGHEPGSLLEAALRLQEKGPDALDINLGCPTRSITARGAGVGLMRTPLKTARIFRTLSRHLEIPLTAKIRLGWDDCRNYLLISRIIAENGGQLIAVHARTREQGHAGDPDWEAIADVNKAVSIPVLGNGGVQRPADASAMLTATGCDGVMIGRAAVKNPWIFSNLDRDQIPPGEVQQLMLTHLEKSLEFYGAPRGLILFRKFAAGYLEPYQLTDQVRIPLLTEESPARFRAKLDDIFASLQSAD